MDRLDRPNYLDRLGYLDRLDRLEGRVITTVLQDFQLSDGSKVAVPMMTQTRKYQWAAMEGLDAAMVSI